MAGALRIDVQNDRQDRLPHLEHPRAATLTPETARSICKCAWFDAHRSHDMAAQGQSRRIVMYAVCPLYRQHQTLQAPGSTQEGLADFLEALAPETPRFTSGVALTGVAVAAGDDRHLVAEIEPLHALILPAS